jgi:hypothetical protein
MRQGACTVREVDLETSLNAFRRLPVGVAVWQLRDPRDVRSLHLIGANPAADRELRTSIGFALGKSISDTFPKLLDTPIPERYRQIVLSGRPETFGEIPYQDARIAESVFWVDCFPLPDRCVGVAFENITERKRMTQAQGHALQLLHRVTILLNEASTVLEAAQFCVDEICTQIGWPVGRFFLCDEMSPSRFLPNPVWYFSNARRFKSFTKATELYECDLTNKLALEYRSLQGQKAGLTKSVGFSVGETGFLHGVMEFSSEGFAPLDEHIFRAISNIGYQLGQFFARERITRECNRVQGLALSREAHQHAMSKILFSGSDSLSDVVKVHESRKRTHRAIARSSKELLESTRQMRQHLDELKRIIAKPLEFPSITNT